MWELSACVEGYNRAHGSEPEPEPPTPEEFDALIEQHRAIVTSDTVH